MTRSISYRNHSIDFHCKSKDWFLGNSVIKELNTFNVFFHFQIVPWKHTFLCVKSERSGSTAGHLNFFYGHNIIMQQYIACKLWVLSRSHWLMLTCYLGDNAYMLKFRLSKLLSYTRVQGPILTSNYISVYCKSYIH